VLTAKTLIANNDTFTRTVHCAIWNGSNQVTNENLALDFGLMTFTQESFESVMALEAPLTLASPGTVTLQCLAVSAGSGDGVVIANRLKLIAIQTGSLTVQ
jgi:hypothetical protein